MGAVSDWFRWLVYGPADPVPALERAAPLDGVSSLIAAAITDRQTTFSLTDAMRLPAVIRGVQLICSTAASFTPLAYRGGIAMPEQPRIVRRPDPFSSRYDFVYQTVYSLITTGDTFWLVGDRDAEGQARSSIVLNPAEVSVQWDERRFLPVYSWRGRVLVRDKDIKHLAIGRGPGELHGRSPLVAGLPALATVAAAEDYALGFFESGGVPEVVLKATATISKEEATALKAQWIASRTGPEPAVFGQGVDAVFPSIDPQRAQMQEARAYGSAVVARLLGIPASLLHVETSGATITYTNPAGAVEEMVKATLAPAYLAPVEAAWSDLVPGTQAVRFDLAELQRADIASRIAMYAQAIPAGVMTAEQARANEGWGPVETEAGHAFDPVPAPSPYMPEVPA